jgi:chitosanase
MLPGRSGIAVVVLLVTLAAAGDRPPQDLGSAWPAPSTGPSAVTLTADQRRVAEQLVNVFEYSGSAARYDVVTDLGDGRGYTCGKIGFTTSSTEVRDVVEAYLARAPHSPLRRYLPRLRELAASGRGDTTAMPDFPEEWARAAKDEVFRAVQDTIADRLTLDPALAAARRIGIRTALGVAILLDTAVQHGTSADPDGLPALVTSATRAAHGDPAAGVPERVWLMAFLDVRANDLRDPHNRDSQQVWAESVDRVDALRRLVATDEHRLAPPVRITVSDEEFVLR